MDVREKLVELIGSTEYGNGSLIGNNFQKGFIEKIASHLIAHGVTVPEWISVKDRLPEGNERVLACYINPLRKDRPPRMMVGEGTSTQLVKGKVYLWCGGWRSITHWMPLPKPPKGE